MACVSFQSNGTRWLQVVCSQHLLDASESFDAKVELLVHTLQGIAAEKTTNEPTQWIAPFPRFSSTSCSAASADAARSSVRTPRALPRAASLPRIKTERDRTYPQKWVRGGERRSGPERPLAAKPTYSPRWPRDTFCADCPSTVRAIIWREADKVDWPSRRPDSESLR